MFDTILISIAVLLRIFSNPLGNVFQKQLTEKGIQAGLVNFLTYFLLSIVILVAMPFIAWQHLGNDFWIYSMLVGLAGALGNGFLIKALQRGDLSVLGPINSYKSVIGIIGGVILLAEIPNIWGMFGIVLIIFGSYFVLDTTRERFSLALFKNSGIQFRLWAMLLTAIEAVFIKKVILVSSAGIAFISWCCFGALFSFALLFIKPVNIKREVMKIGYSGIGKTAFLVCCIGTMQFTTNYVFEHMAVGYALSLFQLSIIISVLLGQTVFKETDIHKKLVGSSFMILGSLLIILLK